MATFATHLFLAICAVVGAAATSAAAYTPHTTLIQYQFNKQVNSCKEGTADTSSYSNEGILFGDLVVPHVGRNAASCAGLDGIRFRGEGGNLFEEGGATASKSVGFDTAWDTARGALIRDIAVDGGASETHLGFGFHLVWTHIDVRYTFGFDAPFVHSKSILFSSEVLTIGISSFGASNYLHFSFEGQSYIRSCGFHSYSGSALNTLSARVRSVYDPANPGIFKSFEILLSVNGGSVICPQTGDKVNGNLNIATSAADILPTNSDNVQFNMGRPNKKFTDKYPNVAQLTLVEAAFRGYIHEIGVYSLQDVDFTEQDLGACSFCGYATNLHLAPTAPRLLHDQLIRLPLRASNVRVPIVYNRDSQPSGFNSLSSYDVNIEFWNYVATVGRIANIPRDNIDTILLSTPGTPQQVSLSFEYVSAVEGEPKELLNVATVLLSSIVNNENLKPDLLLSNGDTACDVGHVVENVELATYDAGVGLGGAQIETFGVCFYDERLEILLSNSDQTRGDKPKVATVILSKNDFEAESVGYTLVVDGVNSFADNAFGVMSGSDCIFSPDSRMEPPLSDGGPRLQLIPFDIAQGIDRVDLCVNVFAFNGFENNAVVVNATTRVNVAVVRRFEGQAQSGEEVVAAIQNIDQVALNRDISVFKAVDVLLLSGVVTCLHQECGSQTMFEYNLDTPTNTSFRLSVTAFQQYFDFRQTYAQHQFTLTVPDVSKGTLYVVEETANTDTLINFEIPSANRIPGRPEARDLISYNRKALKTGDFIYAYDSELDEPGGPNVTIVSRVLEWVPTLNYFNSLVDENGDMSFEYVTGSSIIEECINNDGCPDLIHYSYVYTDATVAPVVPITDVVPVFVQASRTTFTESMLTVPSQYKQLTPLQVEYINDTIWFGSNNTGIQANIQLNSVDNDAEMLNVTIGTEKQTNDLLLYVNPSLSPDFPIEQFVIDEWIQFFDCIPWEVECDTSTSISMRGFPSTINSVFENMYAKVLTQKSIKLVIDVQQDNELPLVSKHFYMSSESAIVRPATSAPASTLAPSISGTNGEQSNNDGSDVKSDENNIVNLVLYVAGGVGWTIAVVTAVVVVKRTKKKKRGNLLSNKGASENPKFGSGVGVDYVVGSEDGAV